MSQPRRPGSGRIGLFQLEKECVNFGRSNTLGCVFLCLAPHHVACFQLDFFALARPVYEEVEGSGFIYCTRYFRSRNGAMPEF